MVPPSDDDPDLQRVELIQAGIDPDANFERLYKRHYSQIFYFFCRRARPDRVEDLTQEVLMRVYKNIKDFPTESSFKTWLFTLMVDLWRNELRGSERLSVDPEE